MTDEQMKDLLERLEELLSNPGKHKRPLSLVLCEIEEENPVFTFLSNHLELKDFVNLLSTAVAKAASTDKIEPNPINKTLH
jgi:hypothetical protein